MQGNQKGFILMEALLATVIISIALVAAIGMFIQSTQANMRAADYTMATSLGQDAIEKLKVGQNPVSPRILNNISYTITYQTSANTVDSRLSNLDVTVVWMERGQSQSIQLATILMTGISPYP